jgi:hypothetical protein
MEAALKEQRQLVRKLGEAERSMGGSTAARTAARKASAEQEYWSEEAGRRFATQQDELVALREANEQLQQHLAAAVPAETAARYESAIKELQQMVHFYERRLAQSNIGAGSSCGLQVRRPWVVANHSRSIVLACTSLCQKCLFRTIACRCQHQHVCIMCLTCHGAEL